MIDYYYNYEPGRLRIRTPYIYHNDQNAFSLEKILKGLDGISTVESDPLTGSILILFDEKIIKHEDLISFLEKHGYFILAKAKTSDEVIEKAAEKVLDVAEEIVEESVDGSLGE